ncbi:aminotransferase class IV family protein [Nocardia farcinica]|nr:aminotransferase class IV family protein [Nocardia farcinica]
MIDRHGNALRQCVVHGFLLARAGREEAPLLPRSWHSVSRRDRGTGTVSSAHCADVSLTFGAGPTVGFGLRCDTDGMELNGSPVTQTDLAALALIGYGHFTSMRVERGGAVRGLSQHLERLVRDCRTVFDSDLDPDRVRALVRQALPAETDGAFVVRVTVFDPHLPLGNPGADAAPQILVTWRHVPVGPLAPLRLRSAVYTRDLPRTKHVGLFGALHQRRLAQRDGFDDVLFTAPDGTISEIATSNIGVLVDGQLIWPQADVLPGVTMRLLGQTLDAEVISKPITLADLAHVDGAVATNAAVGVRAISRIDDADIPVDHAAIDRLRTEYESIPAQQI